MQWSQLKMLIDIMLHGGLYLFVISCRGIQSQGMAQIQQSQSLPAALPMPKTVSYSDEYGINHQFAVQDPVYDHVRALISNTKGAGTTPVFRFGVFHRPSVSSLPSTTSQASSMSSFASGGGTAMLDHC